MMSHLIKIYAVCKFSYFRLRYLKSLLHYVKRFVSSNMRTSSIDVFVPKETKLTFQISFHKLYMEGYKVYFIIYNVMTLNSTSI